MISKKEEVKLSKFLSFILRHKPETIGLTLDEQGWVKVEELLTQMKAHRKHINFETLAYLVENNSKQRFSFNEKRTKIRANQGHSTQVDLGYTSTPPPEVLYHGTARRNIESIEESGLQKQQRHHVHLSADIETAKIVGQRYGKAVIFEVSALQMYEDGYIFYVSDNEVWLTDHVPPAYLNLLA